MNKRAALLVIGLSAAAIAALVVWMIVAFAGSMPWLMWTMIALAILSPVGFIVHCVLYGAAIDETLEVTDRRMAK